MTTRAGRSAGWSDGDLAVIWMCGLGALAGALGGAFVGYLYGHDQALTPAAVPWYAVAGFLLGLVAGLLSGLPPAGTFIALRHRSWAAAPVRIAVTAVVGAAPLTLFQLVVSGFAVPAVAIVFCAVVTGAPAALAAARLTYRSRLSLRR